MQKWFLAACIGMASLCTQTATAQDYRVSSMAQFQNLLTKINVEKRQALQQFIAQLDPQTQQLTPQQLQQYCQITQQLLDKDYQAYDSNRHLFEGFGATLGKNVFVDRFNQQPIVQALKARGVACQYQ